MPSVTELTAPYGNFMLQPRPGPDVCEICFNLTDGYSRCYACTKNASWLDVFVPISYSVGLEQLHHVLRSYKRLNGEIGRRFCLDLAAILWRFLDAHEICLARQAGTRRFGLVTTVPSHDHQRRLQTIVSQLVTPTRARHEPLLRRSKAELSQHQFDPQKFEATRSLENASVLLIDDTWTTGASAQSAAAALKHAGAQTVAAVTIGRHLNRGWRENDRRLRGLPSPYDWGRCAHCATSD